MGRTLSWADCPTPKAGHPCKTRRCPVCGVTWAGDTRTRILANLTSYAGDVAMLTVTAPGRDVLPFDTDGKTVQREAAKQWHATAPARLSQLHRAAWTRAKRQTGTAPNMIARAAEFQKRGVLHWHPILGVKTPNERRAAHAYAVALDQLRGQYGFGFVSDTSGKGAWRRIGLEAISSERAGRYVAKYLTPLSGDGGKASVGETAMHPDAPRQIVYVSRRLTSTTGITMRSLRRRRWTYVVRTTLGLVDDGQAERLVDDGTAAHLVDRARRAHAPPA